MEPDDVAALAAEFPAWDFGATWITVGSGPDVRTLFAWPLDGGPTVRALDAEEMRRKIRRAVNGGPGGGTPRRPGPSP